MDSLKKIKLTAGLSATLLLGGGAAVRDVTVLDVPPIERVEIIAGERVEAKQIDNVVEASFPWKDQPGIKVKYDMGEPTLEEKASDVRKKQVITETVTDFEGGFKVDIILSERPDTNRFCYTIEGAENYDFFYQVPLTDEEVQEGSERPPEIEGSFAVYHKFLRDKVSGGSNYATGKVMHIPRPQVWSLSNEKERQWADLSYEAGRLCVTAPQEFIDTAQYPVRIDPTFGYTSIGGSSITTSPAADVVIYQDTNGLVGGDTFEGGTLTSLSFYARVSGRTIRPVVYNNSDDSYLTHGAEVTTVASTWQTLTVTTTPITAGTEYLIGFWNGGATNGYYYDSPAFYSARLDNGITYSSGGVPPATIASDTNVSNRRMSIYANYDVCDPSSTTCKTVYNDPGDFVWIAPTGVTEIDAACWGGGGGGGDGNGSGGGGGGGGAFASSTVPVLAGLSYNITVGAGGTATNTSIAGTNGGTSTFATTTVVAAPGWGGAGSTGVDSAGGPGGAVASSTGTTRYAGGNGGGGLNTGDVGGGGGGSAGPHGAGGNGAAGATNVGGGGGGGSGGSNGSGSTGGASTNGGAGGNGGNAAAGSDAARNKFGSGGGGGGDDTFRGGNSAYNSSTGEAWFVGGGGGGAEANTNSTGKGASGQCVLTYTASGAASTTPVVETDAATAVGSDTATLNAEITDDGGATITQHGFAWGTNSGLSGGDTATTTLGAGAEGVFDEVLNSLTPELTYYFRAYAVNSEGTTTASILNFTTDAAEPPVTPYTTIKGDVQMKGDVYFAP